MTVVGVSFVVWGPESGKSLLLVTSSEAVGYTAWCVAFSKREGGRLAKSRLNDGRPSQMGSGSDQGFVPKK